MGAIDRPWRIGRPGAGPVRCGRAGHAADTPLAGRSRVPRGRNDATHAGAPLEPFTALLLAGACAAAGLLPLGRVRTPGTLPS